MGLWSASLCRSADPERRLQVAYGLEQPLNETRAARHGWRFRGNGVAPTTAKGGFLPTTGDRQLSRPPSSLGDMSTNGDEGQGNSPDMADELARRIREVADRAEHLRTAQGMSPLANGTLMQELVTEQDFAGPDPWGPDPVMAARNLAGSTLVAAIDYLRSFATAVEAHQPFAPFLNARGVVEACSVAAYLGEQGIGTRERVRRIVNERLLDIHDHMRLVRRLDPPATPAELTTSELRVRALVDVGRSLGFTIAGGSNNRPFALDEQRPSATRIIDRLLSDDLGEIVYHVMSSPSHSRPGGLLRSIEVGPENSLGSLVGNISLTGKDVTMLTSACMLAIGLALDHLIPMNGWYDSEWRATFLPTLAFAQQARIHWWGE